MLPDETLTADRSDRINHQSVILIACLYCSQIKAFWFSHIFGSGLLVAAVLKSSEADQSG